MATYQVILARAAEKTFARLDVKMKRRVLQALARLSENPRHPGAVKLAGEENAWRVRTGSYRILYEIKDQELVVLVVEIGHRREVYR